MSFQENINKLSENSNSKKFMLNEGRSYKVGELKKNITLADTLEIISKKGSKEFYEGSIANDIVNSLKNAGSKATSINTKENNIIEIIPESEELGFVGMPNKINTDIIKNTIEKNSIPIISPLGLGENNQTYNINGDTAAGAIAKSLKSRRLLLMTNVKGVLNKKNKLIEEISSSEISEMIKNKTITEGMIPKINTCLDAVDNGVTAVGIIDGRKKHSILFELFSDKGSGTLIRK